MAIAGGFDIHRRQVTFDYLDTGTGQARRGRIDPACRQGWSEAAWPAAPDNRTSSVYRDADRQSVCPGPVVGLP
jgi:hypothetical protein